VRQTPPPAATERELEGGTSTRQSRPLILGAVAIVGTSVLIAAVAGSAAVEAEQARAIGTVTGTATALCALGIFVFWRDLGRQTDDRLTLWLGTGTLVIGLAAVCRPAVLGAVLGDRGPDDRWLGAVAGAALVVVPVAFAVTLVGMVPSLRKATALGVGLLVALSILFQAVPRLGKALSVSQLTADRGVASLAGGLVVLGAWLAVAAMNVAQGSRRWPPTQAWAGLVLFGMACSQLADGEAGPGNAWGVAGGMIQAVAVAVALAGAHLELRRANEDQTVALFDTTLDAETADARERVRSAGLRARRHDLANAITAIDGAATLLEREFGRLSEADRETLAHVVGAGMARLRAMIDPSSGGTTQVSLAQTAADVAHDPDWPAPLVLEVAPDLVATGSPGETAEAVRQLVDYATRRAPGPVTVRGERDGRWVVLRIEDRGPAMPRELRRSVADPDSRREPGREDAIGVRIAARLMRGQGGDLWVQTLPGGGTAFGICLPAIGETAGDESARDA
jgi:signal transduction histidine kinase